MKIHIPAYEPSLECTERLRHGEIDIDLGEDVVRVVFCKDCVGCEHHYPAKARGEEALDGWYCKYLRQYVRHNHYCGYGERKCTK